MYTYQAQPLGQFVQLDGAHQLQGALRAIRLAVWLSRQWARKDVRLCRRAGKEDPPVHPVLGQGKSRTPAGELQAGSAPPQAAPPLLCLQCALCGHGGCEPHLPTSLHPVVPLLLVLVLICILCCFVAMLFFPHWPCSSLEMFSVNLQN